MATKIQINNVLIADDKEENRRAAAEAVPHAVVVGSGSDAIGALEDQEFDLVITDLNMEQPWSGLDVVEKALERIVIPYTFSAEGRGHDGYIIRLRPEYHGSFAGSKSESILWKRAYDSIILAEGTAEHYHRSILGVKEILGKDRIPLKIPREVIFPMYAYKRDCLPWLKLGGCGK